MIHICFPLHDKSGTYSKFVGTAMCSVLENTNEKVNIHILHDHTLNDQNKSVLKELTLRYNQKIMFYEVQPDSRFVDIQSLDVYTVGTLFRLYIPLLLSREIEKVIYLDADLIVNIDIEQLWNQELKKCSVAASIDIPVANGRLQHILCDKGILDYTKYFNAGVAILNLKKIRENYNIISDVIAFFMQFPQNEFADQDALNFIFKQDVCLLDNQYNTFVSECRYQNIERIEKRIYHYAGEFGRAKYLERDTWDELFFFYLMKTPWGSPEQMREFYERKLLEQETEFQWLQTSLNNIHKKRKVFWGASGKLHDNIRNYFSHTTEKDFYVDNTPAMWGKNQDGLHVVSPEVLRKNKMKDFVVIVVTLRYNEVKKILESWGYSENKDFYEGRKFLAANEGGYSKWKI